MKKLLVTAALFLGTFARANIVGVGPQNYNPTTDGLDFVTVESSQVLDSGILNVGLFLNDAFNTFPYLDTSTQSRTRINDSLIESDFGVGLGLFKGFEVGLTLPMTISQTIGNNTTLHGDFAQTGVTEIRPNVKYQFWGGSRYGAAIMGSVNFDTIQDDPYAGSGAGPTYNLELAAHTTISRFVLGVNVGRRFREPGTAIDNSVIVPLRDQWIASIAGSYLVTQLDTKLIAEIYGAEPALPTSDGNELRNLTSLEMLLGVKHDFSNQISGHAGIGTGLDEGVSTPDWRIYVGINYELGPLWNRKPAVEQVLPPLPEAPELPAPQPVVEFRMSNVPFDFNSDQLGDAAANALAPIIEHMKTTAFTKLVVEGHTDSVGSETYNLNLSQRRANSVRKFLMAQAKVSGSKVQAIGYGASRPIADNGNYQGRQTNRRVEFKFEK